MSIYNVDAGFFPTPVEVCFSSKEFFKILKRYGVPDYLHPEISPLEIGIAETYSFSKNGEAFVIAIFSIEAIAYDISNMAGIVAHEALHVAERIFEHVGEEDDAGEETRAYLMQHLVEQIYQACVMEIHKYAKRKSNRKAVSEASEGKEGAVSEVGKPKHDGGTGQDSPMQRTDPPSGAKRSPRKAISTSDIFSWTVGGDRNKRPRTRQRRRG